MLNRTLAVLGVTLASASLALAQGNQCPTIVATALEIAGAACEGAGRNQACFGNVDLSVVPQPSATNFQFEQIGDIVRVADIANLTLEPLNETVGTWGVAIMRLQANIPDSVPGENVTFVLFGDVSIEPNPSYDGTPLQAFYLRTGIGDSPCAEAPSSGLLVQTPQGANEVVFNVNGVDVNMGSTILFRSLPGEEMTVSALEGAAVMNFDGSLYPVVAGTWARMGLDSTGNVSRPALPTAYVNETLNALPVNLLERRIVPREPFTEEQLDALYTAIRNGQPPCDDEQGLFPVCDRLPRFIDAQEGRARWATDEDWEANLPFRVSYEGRLLDVLLEDGSILLRDDDGSVCVLRTVRPLRETRPRCDERYDTVALGRLLVLIARQRDFRDFFAPLPVATAVPQAPVNPAAPVAPPPAPPAGQSNDNDDDD